MKQTSYTINKNSSIGFDIRKNRKTNATEYYDLFYKYTNDCLVASVKFNKEYYSDSDLKPEKQILLTLTIVPFGKANSPNLNLANHNEKIKYITFNNFQYVFFHQKATYSYEKAKIKYKINNEIITNFDIE